MSEVLRIFSYLPNPRVIKAQIAARICGLEIDVIGAKPQELSEWLWDFDAQPLEVGERDATSPHARASRRGFSDTLFKTDAFLRAHPFGTVPAAFSPDGKIGVFESNSILRAVARAGADHVSLYGNDSYTASRIDSFLDANLVFAREAQVYLLALADGSLSAETYERMASAFEFYFAGIELSVAKPRRFLVGDVLSIADISFVCDVAQFLRENDYVDTLCAQNLVPISNNARTAYPQAFAYFDRLLSEPPIDAELGAYANRRRASVHRSTTV